MFGFLKKKIDYKVDWPECIHRTMEVTDPIYDKCTEYIKDIRTEISQEFWGNSCETVNVCIAECEAELDRIKSKLKYDKIAKNKEAVYIDKEQIKMLKEHIEFLKKTILDTVVTTGKFWRGNKRNGF